MKRTHYDYLEDILGEINRAENFLSKIGSLAEFKKNEMAVYACVRSLEIIGEAAKNVPENERKKYPAIPWKEMAGMRDVLAHNYVGVDCEVVWKTVKQNLPSVKPLIIKALAEEGRKK